MSSRFEQRIAFSEVIIINSIDTLLAGIELIHMIRKGQFAINGADAMSFADSLSALAGMPRPV